MPQRKELGKAGELLAIKYLEGKGYKILEENWRDQHKEIDIIALDKHQIVFVEVKTRKNIYFGSPVEAVNMKKQKYLVDAAEDYIINNNITLDVRFDIISIIMGNNRPRINHIKEAFHPAID
jgi:putative endonuclease